MIEKNLLEQHLSEAEFQIGVDRGWWGVRAEEGSGFAWPHLLAWIKCSLPDFYSDRLYLRFDLSGYNHQAPSASMWDIEISSYLEPVKWPKGTAQIVSIFKAHNHQMCLYHPCDRYAIVGHPQWSVQYGDLLWKPGDKLIKYIRDLHVRINPDSYE